VMEANLRKWSHRKGKQAKIVAVRVEFQVKEFQKEKVQKE